MCVSLYEARRNVQSFTPLMVSIGIWGSPWAVIVAKKKLNIFEGKILELTSKAARDIGGVSVSVFTHDAMVKPSQLTQASPHDDDDGKEMHNRKRISFFSESERANTQKALQLKTFQTFYFRTISVEAFLQGGIR